MLYNICYWLFFLFQGNLSKYLAHPKIRRSKPSLLMFVSLDGFHLLLSTQLTADLTSEWSGRSMFHPLSYIYTKTPFCCVEIIANNTLNRRRVVVFDWLGANAHPLWTQLSHWQMFMQNGEYTTFWYLQLILLSHATSIYDWSKRVWSLLVFSGITAKFGRPEHLALFVSVRTHLKSAYYLLTAVSDEAESE